MLARLVIRDVVLIERLTIDLSPGLNVFTGETGAGKSIVLDALGLALGARGESGLVRIGADQASVTAECAGPWSEAVLALADEQGLDLDDPLLLRRTLGRDGKSRAFIGDQPVPVSTLKRLGAALLEVHGQFATQGLLDPATHGGLLDAFAETEALKRQVAMAWSAWREAEGARDAWLADRARAMAEREYLDSAVAELNALAPEADEPDRLAERRKTLQNREKIDEALRQATEGLDGERGAASAIASVGRALARMVDQESGLASILAAVDRAQDEVAEASQLLDRFRADIDGDPKALQSIEDRLYALRAVARKHGVDPSTLPTLREDLARRLAALDEGEDAAAAHSVAVEAARRAYMTKAEDLSRIRRKAAMRLAESVMREMPPLKLGAARFTVDIAALPETEWGPSGMERVTFLAATNPGTPPGALHKVASGGELSRFMLALKVALTGRDPVPTLVFDEVDAGIGGATASAVGARLAHLAETMQVLVVTHSPQVAARGARHMRVAKATGAQSATTHVETLDDPARIEEIARMLSGATVTDAARQAAQSLLTGDSSNGDSAPPATPPPLRARRKARAG